MSDVLKRFGKFFLLDMIAQGGMAEIYRALEAALDNKGSGRLIVVKRIQKGFGDNNEFVQMFRNEVDVTMGFKHPNIVQVYGYGTLEEQPYIAMEYVEGKNLRQFLTRFNDQKQTFPADFAAYVVEQAASALYYANTFKNSVSGEPLNIVHRDISPQNILVSYEGTVKVIDFGIAKAKTNSESTRAGVIKGKPSYLSPEQISGLELDGRSDIFALGTVLWELLTGRKLFSGDNDLAVLKLIESCNTYVKAPSSLNPKVPKELDYIVLKMLAKDRDRRQKNGEELQRELHKFIYFFNPDFNPSDLSYTAKELFKGEIVEDKKKLQKLNERYELLALTDPTVTGLGLTASGVLKATGIERSVSPGVPRQIDSTLVEPLAGSNNTGLKAITTKAGNVEVEMAPVLRAPQRSGAAGTSTQQRSIGTSRTQASSVGVPSARRNEKSGGLLSKAVIGVVLLLLASFFGPDLGFEVPFLSTWVSEWTGGSVTKVILLGASKEAVISVNGQQVATGLPATLKGLMVGVPLHLQVNNADGGIFQQEIILRKAESKDVVVNFTKVGVQAQAGSALKQNSIILKFQVNPSGAGMVLQLNGKQVDPTTLRAQVVLDTSIEVSVERPGFLPLRREFVVPASQVSGLSEWPVELNLEPQNFGYLTLRSTPSADIVITQGGLVWNRKTPIENEKFPLGVFRVKLQNEVLGMSIEHNFSVAPGKSVLLEERLEIRR